jgi:hypothetical protein
MTETLRGISAPPIAPLDDLHARVAVSVAERGFIPAWRDHFREISRAHAEGRYPDGRLLGPSLRVWMAQDAQLCAAVPAVAAGEAAPAPAASAPWWDSLLHRDFVGGLRRVLREGAVEHAEVLEADGMGMSCVPGAVFQNWGMTVRNTPELTFIPRTVAGVQNVVKWAAARGRSVRASGYRHSWGDLYSADGQVLVSMLPLAQVEDLPASEPGIDPGNELQGIRIVGTVVEDGVTRALCRIGAATTNEQFRRWCLSDEGGAWQWTVPLNVIMVEITWGGSNAPVCHGAGWRNRTLSDLVAEIEFVNARGEVQVVRDPEQLRAAAGCFGLLGVVTAVTLRLDPMSYAVMQPVKTRLALTIPPPAGLDLPPAVDMSGITASDLSSAWDEFVRRCENDYYAEWFWFPYQPDCWVNGWSNVGRREDARDYPSPAETVLQEAEEYLAQLLVSRVLHHLPGKWEAEFLAASAMAALPDGDTIVAPLIDALHFRRGIQNMRVLDMELEIPIPPRADDPTLPDWSVCQKAWWAVIDAVYRRRDAPMRIALEMRVMADSAVTMAPQYGNTLGTCAIEVLTTPNVAPGDWLAFCQEVADAWCALTGPDGRPLNVRPHWAKQWQGLRFRGLEDVRYLTEVAYRERIPEFAAALRAVAREGGCTPADLRIFSNPLLDRLFAPVFA